MSQRPHHRVTPFAGPRALAVLSCALALLATQPWRTSAQAAAAPMSVRTLASTGAGEAATVARVAPVMPREIRTAAAVAARRQIARAEAHAQLHATWTLLHHLLARPLAAPQLDVLHVLAIALHEPASFIVAPVATPLALPPACTTFSPPVMERVFAIGHCLLAPPPAC